VSPGVIFYSCGEEKAINVLELVEPTFGKRLRPSLAQLLGWLHREHHLKMFQTGIFSCSFIHEAPGEAISGLHWEEEPEIIALPNFSSHFEKIVSALSEKLHQELF
jgi:hypothetical protein